MPIDRRRFMRCATLGAAAAALAAEPRRRTKAATSQGIGYVPVLGAAPLIVFARSGMAREAGLDLVLVKLDATSAALPALDVVATGVAPIVQARGAGAAFKIVASLATAGAGFVAVPELAARFYANGDDPAKAFAAFHAALGRPANLATTPAGIVPDVLLHHWLFVRHAVPEDLVAITPMNLPLIQASIMAGTVDGATLPEPMSTIVRVHDARLQRITTGHDMFPDMPGVVLGASAGFLSEYPDVCRILVRGIVDAAKMIRDRPADATPLVADALDVAEPDQPLVTRALASSNLGFVTDPRAIEASTRKLIAYQTLLGDFKVEPDTSDLFDVSFYRDQ